MAVYESGGGYRDDVACAQLDLLDFQKRSYVLYKAQDIAVSLDFDYVVVGPCVQEHGGNSAVDVIKGVGLKVHQAKDSGKESSLWKAEADELVDLCNELFKVVGGIEVCADDRLQDDHAH